MQSEYSISLTILLSFQISCNCCIFIRSSYFPQLEIYSHPICKRIPPFAKQTPNKMQSRNSIFHKTASSDFEDALPSPSSHAMLARISSDQYLEPAWKRPRDSASEKGGIPPLEPRKRVVKVQIFNLLHPPQISNATRTIPSSFLKSSYRMCEHSKMKWKSEARSSPSSSSSSVVESVCCWGGCEPGKIDSIPSTERYGTVRLRNLWKGGEIGNFMFTA